jgi:hypothetical protein
MRAGGIPDQSAARASDALWLLTVTTALEHGVERRRAPTAPHHKSPAADYSGTMRRLCAALSADRYPVITSMAVTLTRCGFWLTSAPRSRSSPPSKAGQGSRRW